MCLHAGTLAQNTTVAQPAAASSNSTLRSAYVVDLGLRFTGPTLVPFTVENQIIMIQALDQVLVLSCRLSLVHALQAIPLALVKTPVQCVCALHY